MTDERKLVTLRTVDAITPIQDADAIETAHVGGWTVVIKKGEFTVGEKVFYFEIDAFLPKSDPRFERFSLRGEKKVTLDGGETVVGHVLKTARLRGQISQGLLLPLADFPEVSHDEDQEMLGKSFTEMGVFKYEAPIPPSLSGQVKGKFAEGIVKKTDSERVQNLSDEFLQEQDPQQWVATEKVDGTSATFIMGKMGLRLFSRNLELTPQTEESRKTTYDRIAEQWNLSEHMPVGSVIQGEIYGEGIQKNPLKIQGQRLRVFYTRGMEEASDAFKARLEEYGVPVYKDIRFPQTVQEAVEQADGLKSILNPKVNAEGIVWWNTEGAIFRELRSRSNFKAINNKFLLRQK